MAVTDPGRSLFYVKVKELGLLAGGALAAPLDPPVRGVKNDSQCVGGWECEYVGMCALVNARLCMAVLGEVPVSDLW